jgi:hypothetical protein
MTTDHNKLIYKYKYKIQILYWHKHKITIIGKDPKWSYKIETHFFLNFCPKNVRGCEDFSALFLQTNRVTSPIVSVTKVFWKFNIYIFTICVFVCHVSYVFKSNLEHFWQMSHWSPVYVPEIETGRHVKNNTCTVEIKNKIELCRLPLRHRLFLSCDCHGITDRTCKQKSWLKCVCFLYKIHVMVSLLMFCTVI